MTDELYHPAFKEEQRDAVCKGELCPTCLQTDKIKNVGCNPDGINMNNAFDCECGAQWEGY